ncbi:MAG: LuxR C-terminal-related transcriptional regulator [Armatimonadota bacterium]|nr:LuxR C-terminal-related transcriptional regulator [Armatimonadota bacterium]
MARLLERGTYLQGLTARLDEAQRGRGALVFVGGEAGVGKTSLARLFCDIMRERARIAWGRCEPLSTPSALGPVLEIAQALDGGAAQLLETGERRVQTFRLLLDGLSARPKPALLVLEDLHWADEATLDFVRFAGRRIASTRALAIATYRDDEVGPDHPLRILLGDLATAEGVHRMTLPPLTEAAVRVLAEGSGLDAAALHRRTGGNPFFLTEILDSGGTEIPVTVRDAVLARAARLSPDARAVLDVCAVAGPRIEPWLLEAIGHHPPEAVDECLSRGMLRSEEGSLTFRHELARDAFLTALSPQRALTLHRAVLAALRASSLAAQDPVRLAHHAEAAGDADAVLAFAPEAGRRAASLGAHREAAAQFERALRFSAALSPQRHAELLEAYAEQCWITERLSESIAADTEAVRIWREEGDCGREAVALLRLARTYVRDGRNAEAEQASLVALEILEAGPPSAHLAAAYRTRAMLLMMDRRNPEAIAFSERAVELAQQFDDVESLAMAYNFLGAAVILLGRLEEGRAFLERSLTLARDRGFDHLVAWAYWNLGSALGEVYDVRNADHYLTAGIAYCAERDLDTSRSYMMAWKSLVDLYRGRWEPAAAEAAAVLTRPGTATTSRIMALVALGRLHARRGDAARDALDEALALASRTGTLQRVAPARAARAEAAWLAGDLGRAAEEARAAYDLAMSRAHPWFTGELAYWRWRAGDRFEAPEWLAAPFALQIAGRWREAAAEWERLGCPYETARALAEGDDEDALRQALLTYERLGARPMAAVTARRLREIGAGSIPRGPRPTTRAHPAGLTAREAEVLDLLAEGLPYAKIADRLHLSPKTVEHHVSAVLSKLGARTRAEAVREAARRGLIVPSSAHQSGA